MALATVGAVFPPPPDGFIGTPMIAQSTAPALDQLITTFVSPASLLPPPRTSALPAAFRLHRCDWLPSAVRPLASFDATKSCTISSVALFTVTVGVLLLPVFVTIVPNGV